MWIYHHSDRNIKEWQNVKVDPGSFGETRSAITDRLQNKPRLKAGVTGDAVLFCYSFLLME